MTLDMFRRTGAQFSPCRTWRYTLTREWDAALPPVNFVMLNPSTADEETNDPTVERCERYARRWGYGGIVVTNLFAFRATDPTEMRAASDPVGPGNDTAILWAAARCRGHVVCAWGNHGSHLGRSDDVLKLLRGHRYPDRRYGDKRFEDVQLTCLAVNRSGEPVHPLYQRADLRPVPYERRAA